MQKISTSIWYPKSPLLSLLLLGQYIGVTCWTYSATAAEQKSVVLQSESACPCVSCAQRWFARWIPRPHPYTQNEQKFTFFDHR